MRFRALDSNWDWKFGKGANDFSVDSSAVAYDIKSRILSWFGDCFFATNEGIDWKNILGSKNKKEELDRSIEDIILSNDNVIELTSFESYISGRDYHCSAKFKTIYGETIEVKI